MRFPSLLFAVVVCVSNVSHLDAQEAAWLRSAKSGTWSAPATWEGGNVPGAGARVHIRPGHAVLYDVDVPPVLRAVNVGGTLTFARDRNTRMDVGLLRVAPGDAPSEEGFDCDGHAMDS